MKNLKAVKQKQSMFEAMLAFVFGPLWSVIIMAILPIQQACNSLRDRKTALAAKLALYEELLQSIAQSKDQARLTLAAQSFAIMSSVRSYAVKNGLSSLAEQLVTSYAKLSKMTFETLLAKTQLAIDLIEPLIPSLVAYQVTADSIETWRANHQALTDLMGESTAAYKQRTQLGESIENDMNNNMEFFNNQFSPLFATFMISQPDLFGAFMRIKRIGNPNIHHTRLIAQCVSELNVPYFGLTVQVNAYTDPKTHKTYEAVIGFSNVNGIAEVSGFFPANRTVTISGPGVVATTFPPIKFGKAKTVDHQFVLQPSSFELPAPVQSKQKVNS